jgi:hypothetical protein
MRGDPENLNLPLSIWQNAGDLYRAAPASNRE